MAIMPQSRLSSWKDVENLGELKRLRLVLRASPHEALTQRLELQRGRGRGDYPIRAAWDSILAGIVFEHRCIESP